MVWEKDFFRKGIVTGFDEAGRGPIAGPVTVALVAFPAPVLEQIRRGEVLGGLDDSKKLRPAFREELFGSIVRLSLFYSIQHVSHRFIDQWNINQAIFYGILRALKRWNLPQKPFLLLDGNYKWEHCLIRGEIPDSLSIPKADQSIPSVQAASILAKVSRDRLMEHYSRKYPDYGFSQNKGYGTKSHLESIKKYGLTSIHRKTFIRH